jgi:TPR repeat protein
MFSASPDASLEQCSLHLRPTAQLLLFVEQRIPEALLVYGGRLRNGIGVRMNTEEGWRLTVEAAHMGHPVAMALCYDLGEAVPRNVEAALALYQESAERGHPVGKQPVVTCSMHRTMHVNDDRAALLTVKR